MELKSFLAGILFLFAAESLLPFLGVKVSVAISNPLLGVVASVAALIVAYYLIRR